MFICRKYFAKLHDEDFHSGPAIVTESEGKNTGYKNSQFIVQSLTRQATGSLAITKKANIFLQ
jgi:hypothetical protein